MDISMPNMNGLDAAREIKGILPATEIVMVSQHDSAEMVRQAFKAGARGYVMKSSISSDLLAAIASVNGDKSFRERHADDVNHDSQEILNRTSALEKALQENEERLRLARMIMRVGTFEWNFKTDVNHWTAGNGSHLWTRSRKFCRHAFRLGADDSPGGSPGIDSRNQGRHTGRRARKKNGGSFGRTVRCTGFSAAHRS